VQGAPGYLDARLGQPTVLAKLDAERSLQDLHPLVLAQVQVARDAAARVQQAFLEQLPARRLAGPAGLQGLTGEGAMQRAHRRPRPPATTTMPSVASAAVARSTPAR
jgi:hypothetical protein